MTLTIRTKLLCASFSLLAIGCSDGGDEGPIDGSWTLSATTCDGAPAQFPPYVIDIAGDEGSFALTFAPDCVAAFEESYTYGQSSIEITPLAVDCAPDAGCMEAIGASCPALPPPVTYDFERAGDQLEFSKISVGPPADPCPEGAEVRFVMTRSPR